MFKCRYCGEEFSGPSYWVADNIVRLAQIFHTETAEHDAQDYAYRPHIGVGDFIGYKIVPESEI